MLGEELGHEIGQTTGLRVLAQDAEGVKMEVSFTAAGKLLGVDATDMGTYISTIRPDGTMYGEGQGVQLTSDGDTVLWRGNGTGRMTGVGTATEWRGALYFQTTSQRLARLNGACGVYEYRTDESGKTEATTYEWK